MWPEPAERKCLACTQLLYHRANHTGPGGRYAAARALRVTDRERARRTARPRRDAEEVLPHPSPAEAAAQERSENPYAGRS
jgi:hypothetical protein